jgi:hypothetical protein
MLGICLLSELLDLDDQSALDSFSFDLRWQHALGVPREDAYLSRRSLVDFRGRMVGIDPEMRRMRLVFLRVVEAAILDLKLDTGEQRLDSTRIMSNICTRGRGDLFAKTIRHFLSWLWKHHRGRMADCPQALQTWYEKDENCWFGERDQAKKRAKLQRMAEWMQAIRVAFKDDVDITSEEPYQLVIRVLTEHCELASAVAAATEGTPGSGGAPVTDAAAAPAESTPTETVIVRAAPESIGTSLQSPFDPDAGYGHKGAGYHLQITETCANEKVELIVDFGLQSAGERDFGQSTEVLDRLAAEGHRPTVLFVDGGYPSGRAIVEAEDRGTELYGPVHSKLPADTIGREAWALDPLTGRLARCPAGKPVLRHELRTTSRNLPPTLHAYIAGDACRACPMRAQCVARGPNNGKKGNFHVEDTPAILARDQRAAAMRSKDWWLRYRVRSGIEATNSELKRAHGVGRLRVRRRPRVTLSVAAKLTACNIKRWLRAA